MFVDIWAWFNQYRRDAQGNPLKERMVEFAEIGWKYQRLAEAEKAIAAFEDGYKAAKILKEPCWELFYQHWIIVIRLYVQYDYQSTLDSTIRLVTEQRKAQYDSCVVRGQIVFLLAMIYYFLDLNAYEAEILRLFDYLEKELGMDEDSYLQMLVTRANIEIHHKRYAEAKAQAENLINLSQNSSFRQYDGYAMLRRLAFIEGDILAALEHNRIAQKHAHAMQIQNCVANEKLWEAVFLKYAGDDALAREKYYLALAHYHDYKIPLDANYQAACIEYLELDKQIEAALHLSQSLLTIVDGKPSVSQQMDAYCMYIALLGRSGKDTGEALAKAKTIASTSPKPEPYLARLSHLEAGHYFDYEWQKTSRKNQGK